MFCCHLTQLLTQTKTFSAIIWPDFLSKLRDIVFHRLTQLLTQTRGYCLPSFDPTFTADALPKLLRLYPIWPKFWPFLPPLSISVWLALRLSQILSPTLELSFEPDALLQTAFTRASFHPDALPERSPVSALLLSDTEVTLPSGLHRRRPKENIKNFKIKTRFFLNASRLH